MLLLKTSISFSKELPFPILYKSFKKEYSNNPFVLTKYNRQFSEYLSFLIKSNQWQYAHKLTQSIKLNYLNNWRLITTISQTLSQSINQIHSFHNSPILSLLNLMKNLNYQPFDQDHPQFYQILQKHIKYLPNYQLLKIANAAIISMPKIFPINELSQIVLEAIKGKDQQSKNYASSIIIHGIMSDCWSKDFLHSVRKISLSNKTKSIRKHIDFADTQIPNHITMGKQKQQNKSSTQTKIGDLLTYLDYNLKENILLNQFQIDFLLGTNVIVEYNGIHHYRINSSTLKESVKQIWKRKMLEKRGFIYCSISFEQWDSIQDTQGQRLFLIQRIENTILRSISQQ